MSRVLIILTLLVQTGVAFAQSTATSTHYRAETPGIVDSVAANFAGLEACGDQYGAKNKDLSIDDVVSFRCAFGSRVDGTARGARVVTDTIHQLLFQQIARNSHQASLCQESFFDSYLKQPAVAEKFNAEATSSYASIRDQLKTALAKKERYEFLKRILVNAYNGSPSDRTEFMALSKEKAAIDTALVLLPKAIPLGNNPLIEDLVIRAAQTNMSDAEFQKNYRDTISVLKQQATKSVATFSDPKVRAKDGSYKVSREMQTAFVKSGEMQSLIENSDASPRAKNIALCQMQAIYDRGATYTDRATMIGETVAITALTYLAPPIGVELAGASVAARSAYSARALMLASRSTRFAIQSTVLLASLPAIKSACFNQEFLSSSRGSCNPQQSFEGVMNEKSIAACAANVALASTAFLIKPLKAAAADAKPAVEAASAKAAIEAVPLAENPFKTLVPHVADEAQLKIWQLEEAGQVATSKSIKRNLESRLKSARIAKIESLNASKPKTNATVGDPYLVTFEDGSHGIWKPEGRMQDPKIELAAYAVDQRLRLNQVPITVARTIEGQAGTIQFYVGNSYGGAIRDPHSFALLDTLLRNSDRNTGNTLIKDGRPIAIDHGYAMNLKTKAFAPEVSVSISDGVRAAKEAQKNFKITMKSPADVRRLQQVETGIRLQMAELIGQRQVYENLVSTSSNEWRRILGPNLNSAQMDQFLSQRFVIIREVDEARALLGNGIFSDGLTSPIQLNRQQYPLRVPEPPRER